jgi:hypothetical protein
MIVQEEELAQPDHPQNKVLTFSPIFLPCTNLVLPHDDIVCVHLSHVSI